MPFEFTAEEKTSIKQLTGAGWPDSMAEAAVAAKRAGLDKAEENLAGFVKVMSKGEGSTKAELEAKKKKLREDLAKLVGDRSFPAIQRSIALKRQLANLGV